MDKLINKIGSNQLEIPTSEGKFLFSYETPVAYETADGKVYVTQKKYSLTTTKHINRWLQQKQNPVYVPQEAITATFTGAGLFS